MVNIRSKIGRLIYLSVAMRSAISTDKNIITPLCDARKFYSVLKTWVRKIKIELET